MKRGARIAVRYLVGLAISAFFVWLTLRGKDLGALWAAFRRADYLYLVPYVGILLVIHLLRTVRWGILLEPVGKPGFLRLNRACAVGFMALIVLPFRLGELARPYLVSSRGAGEGEAPIRMSAATASIVVERVVDAIFTASLLLVTLLVTVPQARPEDIDLVRGWSWIILAGFLSVLAGLVLVFWQRRRAVALATRLLTPLSPRLAERVAGLLESFIGGLRLVPSRGKLALFVLLTVAYWGVNGAGMLVLAQGFDLHLSLVEMYTVLGVLVIGVMIPAGPGMVGTFQFFVLLGLSLFVAPEALDGSGAAYANVLWAAQFGQQVLLGLVFLLAGRVSFGRLIEGPADRLASAAENDAGA